MSWFDYNNDLFEPSDFNNIEYGGDGNDVLTGNYVQTCPDDVLCIVGGYYTRDYLEGNGGDDVLNGGRMDDVLVGVNPDEYNAGNYEYDTLTGGNGSDIFVLGDTIEAYYRGFGFATITDFNWEEDKIVVHGSASDYSLEEDIYNGGIDILYQGDLIGYVSNTVDVLISEDFIFL